MDADYLALLLAGRDPLGAAMHLFSMRSLWGAAGPPTRQQPRTVRLPDGSLGWFMRRRDDCLQAAIASVLQVPITEVPDAHIDRRLRKGEDPDELNRQMWAELAEWLAGRGLEVVVHPSVPVPADRWIGIVPKEGDFQSHCLVMSHEELLHDPARGIAEFERQQKVRIWGPDDVMFGLTFEPRQRSK